MTTGIDFLSIGVAIWAGLCILATAGLVALSPRIGRLRAVAWMITIAVVLLVEEDPTLLMFMASAGPGVDRDGVLGIVHTQTRAHMYGGAGWALGAMFLSVLVAHRWLGLPANAAPGRPSSVCWCWAVAGTYSCWLSIPMVYHSCRRRLTG